MGRAAKKAVVNESEFPPLQLPVVDAVKPAEETKVDSPRSVAATDEAAPVFPASEPKDENKKAEQIPVLAKKASTSKFRRPADVLLDMREKAKEAKNVPEPKKEDNNNAEEEDEEPDEVDEALNAISRFEKMITVVSPRAQSLNEPIRVPSPQLTDER